MGAVGVLFDRETTGVEEGVMWPRHDNEDVVVSNVHGHVGGRHCVERFVLEGSLEGTSAFVGTLRGEGHPQRRLLRAPGRRGRPAGDVD